MKAARVRRHLHRPAEALTTAAKRRESVAASKSLHIARSQAKQADGPLVHDARLAQGNKYAVLTGEGLLVDRKRSQDGTKLGHRR